MSPNRCSTCRYWESDLRGSEGECMAVVPQWVDEELCGDRHTGADYGTECEAWEEDE